MARQAKGNKQASIWTAEMPPSGDHDRNQLWIGVGTALTMWAKFEAELGRLFTAFIVPHAASIAAERTFGAIRSFEGRREVLIAAGEAYFAYHPEEPTDYEMFRTILKDGQKASEIRNNIAHGAVQAYLPPGKAEPNGSCLLPSYYDSKRRDVYAAPEFAYNAATLFRFSTQFQDLTVPASRLTAIIVMRARASLHRFPLRSPPSASHS